jgi:integrase
MPPPRITRKYAPTTDEFNDILKTLENWEDEYGRTGQFEARQQYAFCMLLAWTGQRISDVVMFNDETFVCEDGHWFAALTQIKTGRFVKVPVEAWLVKMATELPFVGESEDRIVIKPAPSRPEIEYGRNFWFWTILDKHGDLAPATYRQNAKNYSDKVTATLKRAETERSKKWEHHTTPHCFRHWFAFMMLKKGKVYIEEVSHWLGHASKDITMKHYGHYNSEAYKVSASKHKTALKNIGGSVHIPSFAKKRVVVEIPKSA